MATKTVLEILEEVERLPLDDQLFLLTVLAQRARATYRRGTSQRSWKEMCGAVPYPALGEDAQEWVTRSRRESDLSRSLPEDRTK